MDVWGEAGKITGTIQGQYFDVESGLHYNRFRYYDPITASYISQDPIGLAGDLNVHSYVHNPMGWVDPLGLTASCELLEKRDKLLDKLSKKIHQGQQDKHIIGTNNYKNLKTLGQEKSPLVPGIDTQGLLDGIHDGKYPIIGIKDSDLIVDFKQTIGQTKVPGSNPARLSDTQLGKIHSGKKGAHIVPFLGTDYDKLPGS